MKLVYIMATVKFKLNTFILIIIFLGITNNLYAKKAYFDLSQNEINIKTNFTGQELILFGIVEPNNEVIVVVKGPEKNITVRNKKRILGFWFNAKSIIYQNVPSVYFISSSVKINEILEEKEIFSNKLSFDSINFIPESNKDLFIDLTEWNKSLIRIQKQNDLFKEFELKIVDGKLFQTRLYFPSNIPTGVYNVDIYQAKNKQIFSSSSKIIKVDKIGIGNKIYIFAKNESILYGILAIILAVFFGIFGAIIFRKL